MVEVAAFEHAARDFIAPLKTTLTNDVHPIVGPERFPADFPYAKFLPVARLVTRLLQSPAAEHFMSAVWFGTSEQADLTATQHFFCVLRERFRAPIGVARVLDGTTQAAVRRQLSLLVPHITYEVRDIPDHSLIAVCESGSLDPKRPSHSSSKISISRRVYDHYLENGMSEEKRLACIVDTSSTIVHELGHAIHEWGCAAEQEPFFNDSIAAEMGHEFVATIFGGVPDMDRSPTWHGLELLQWPSQMIADAYGAEVMCRDTQSLPNPGLVWRNLQGWARCLLKDDFWDRRVRDEGAKALVPKVVAKEVRRCMHRGLPAPVPSYVRGHFLQSTNNLPIIFSRIAALESAVPVLQPRKTLRRQRLEEIWAPLGISLTNDIHPLVSPYRFSGSIPYVDFLPCARLVSRLLESPAAEGYFCTMFFGVNRNADHRASKSPQCLRRERIDPPAGLPVDLDTETRKAVREQLELMAPFLMFYYSDVSPALARCYPQEEHGYNDVGIGVHIALDTSFLRSFQEPNMTPLRRFLDIFRMATVILHEIGHAVHRWISGPAPEDFLGDSIYAEAGHELVASIFGGIPDLRRGEEGLITKIRQWPCTTVLPRHTYNHRSECRDPGRLPDPGMCWEFPLGLAKAMLADEFWDVTVAAEGAKALIPEDIAAVVKRTRAYGGRGPVPASVSELFRTGGIAQAPRGAEELLN